MEQHRLDGRALNAWRQQHGLYVWELAIVFGYTLGKVKDRLYGRIDVGMTCLRMTENIDMLLHVGVMPSGWPHRLMHRVHVNRIDHAAAMIDE